MLLGVHGGGKSLAAKAVARICNIPLLRLDFGVLYNKFFGETERNIGDALHTAEVLAPCVAQCDRGLDVAAGCEAGGVAEVDQNLFVRIGAAIAWLAPVFFEASPWAFKVFEGVTGAVMAFRLPTRRLTGASSGVSPSECRVYSQSSPQVSNFTDIPCTTSITSPFVSHW